MGKPKTIKNGGVMVTEWDLMGFTQPGKRLHNELERSAMGKIHELPKGKDGSAVSGFVRGLGLIWLVYDLLTVALRFICLFWGGGMRRVVE